MPRVPLLRSLVWLVLALVVGIKVADYTLRLLHHGPAGVFTGGPFNIAIDVSTTLRMVLTAAIAIALVTHTRDRTRVAAAALLVALYAGYPALLILENRVGEIAGKLLLMPLLLAALNYTATRYFQLVPEPVTRLPLNRVLAFFIRPLPLFLFALVPVLAMFMGPLRGRVSAAWAIAMVALQFAYLRLNLNAEPEYRKRLFWVAEGMLLILFANIFTMLVAAALNASGMPVRAAVTFWIVNETGHWAALFCFAIAIFFYDAVDSGLVVKHTLAGGLASATSLLLFITMESLLSDAFASALHAQTRSATIVAGVLAAVAFKPVESRAARLFARFSRQSAEAVVEHTDLNRPINELL